MSDRLKELRDKRGKLVADMQALVDKAGTEKRELTGEENARYEEMFKAQETVAATIKTEERQQELAREAATQALKGKPPAGDETDEQRTVGPRGTKEYRSAFANYLAGGIAKCAIEEQRALSANAGDEGGYLVPEQMMSELIKAVDDMVFIRKLGTAVPVSGGKSIGIPTLDADPADADWTTELGTGSEDSTMKLGKRKMEAHPVAKRIKVSNELIRISALGVEALVRERLAYKFGISLEKAYLTGNGVDKPLGLFVASNDGIPTSRDVATDNGATAPTFDGLINAKYSVKAAYWSRAQWLFHRDCVKLITKLKDSDGQYLWRPSVQEGEPDRILGHALNVSEYVPNTFTTGLYVGMFADFSFYRYLDVLELQIQRLVELYAETNQTGFIGRYEGDGAPVLAEAFARVKLG